MSPRVLILLFLCFFSATATCQILDDDDSLVFICRVKQIDEFIERFNGSTSDLCFNAIKKIHPQYVVNRHDYIKSLFFSTQKANQDTIVQSFLNTITHPSNPIFLNFYDNDWYAEVTSIIKYKGVQDTCRLIMEVQKENLGSKWVIRSVKSKIFDLPLKSDSSVYLNPVSHETGFMNLNVALTQNKGFIKNYVYNNFKINPLSLFVYGLITNDIKFIKVINVRYHFLQINGWNLIVEKYERYNRSSGWLISSLFPADNDKKQEYRRVFLNFQ